MNVRMLVSEWLWETLCVFQIEDDFVGQIFFSFRMRENFPRNVFFVIYITEIIVFV